MLFFICRFYCYYFINVYSIRFLLYKVNIRSWQFENYYDIRLIKHYDIVKHYFPSIITNYIG